MTNQCFDTLSTKIFHQQKYFTSSSIKCRLFQYALINVGIFVLYGWEKCYVYVKLMSVFIYIYNFIWSSNDQRNVIVGLYSFLHNNILQQSQMLMTFSKLYFQMLYQLVDYEFVTMEKSV